MNVTNTLFENTKTNHIQVLKYECYQYFIENTKTNHIQVLNYQYFIENIKTNHIQVLYTCKITVRGSNSFSVNFSCNVNI